MCQFENNKNNKHHQIYVYCSHTYTSITNREKKTSKKNKQKKFAKRI